VQQWLARHIGGSPMAKPHFGGEEANTEPEAMEATDS
jgi:hypothetical protein